VPLNRHTWSWSIGALSLHTDGKSKPMNPAWVVEGFDPFVPGRI